MALGLLARKKGMTQFRTAAGDMIPVTVLEAGPCVVVALRTKKSHGYEAIQVGFELVAKVKRVNKARTGHFAKAKLPPYRVLREFRCESAGNFAVGQQLTVAVFQPGDLLTVRGRTIGRGFQGVVKRHGKAGGPGAHGSHFHRLPGSIGMRTWPGRVIKNMKMPGHMGDVQVSVRNIEVVEVDAGANLLLVKGGLPGHDNSVVRLENADRKFAARFTAPGRASEHKAAAAAETSTA